VPGELVLVVLASVAADFRQVCDERVELLDRRSVPCLVLRMRIKRQASWELDLEHRCKQLVIGCGLLSARRYDRETTAVRLRRRAFDREACEACDCAIMIAHSLVEWLLLGWRWCRCRRCRRRSSNRLRRRWHCLGRTKLGLDRWWRCGRRFAAATRDEAQPDEQWTWARHVLSNPQSPPWLHVRGL